MNLHIGIPEAIVLVVLLGRFAASIAVEYKKHPNELYDKMTPHVIISLIVLFSWMVLLYCGGFFK